jgi:subtilisin family serine protease
MAKTNDAGDPSVSGALKGGTVKASGGQTIPGQYVVLFKDSGMPETKVKSLTASLANKVKGATLQTYGASVKGFAVKTNTAGAKKLASDPNVSSVRQDEVVKVSSFDGPSNIQDDAKVVTAASAPTKMSAVKTPGVSANLYQQYVPNPPNSYWGLDRIDQRPAVLNNAYLFYYTAPTVRVYILDTGIRATHTQFAGRVLPGATAINDGYGTDDCNGHGTHVSGIVGGSTYGVAKSVRLVPVRVLDCGGSGSYSGVIAGVDWVTRQKALYPNIPMVANMSLGGSWYWPLDLAVHRSIEAGVTYTVSAGNSVSNACNYSPADTLSAITVGAMGDYEDPYWPDWDERSSFSNYGGCVDLFAPGAWIRSSTVSGSSNTASATWSGTSMAAPHAAGVAALYLSLYPAANPMAVRNWMVSVSTKNMLRSIGSGSPNALLYNPL